LSKVIAYKNKQGKYNITIIGDDVKQNILLASNQGFERKAGVETCLAAALEVLRSNDYGQTPTEYMTNAQYQAFLRQRRRGK
jgi:hypothetical protein